MHLDIELQYIQKEHGVQVEDREGKETEDHRENYMFTRVCRLFSGVIKFSRTIFILLGQSWSYSATVGLACAETCFRSDRVRSLSKPPWTTYTPASKCHMDDARWEMKIMGQASSRPGSQAG